MGKIFEQHCFKILLKNYVKHLWWDRFTNLCNWDWWNSELKVQNNLKHPWEWGKSQWAGLLFLKSLSLSIPETVCAKYIQNTYVHTYLWWTQSKSAIYLYWKLSNTPFVGSLCDYRATESCLASVSLPKPFGWTPKLFPTRLTLHPGTHCLQSEDFLPPCLQPVSWSSICIGGKFVYRESELIY